MLTPTLFLATTLAMSTSTQTEAVPSSQAQNTNVDDQWLLSYVGKTTNQARWDPRLTQLLSAGLPPVHNDFYDAKLSLPEVALIALSGPPEPVSIESNRYVTLAATIPQVGELKGLLWVDTGTPDADTMIFAEVNQDAGKPSKASLALFTRSDEFAAKLPPQFVSSLTGWLSRKGIKHLTGFTMTNAKGEITHLPLDIIGFY